MSKIEVNQIGPQCGTTVTVGCGAGQTVAVDAATVNLGRSGGTVNLTCGATQSGFGRTGTVNWQTDSIKTTTFTAANGEGYFANTSGGTFTMNFPAGVVGNIVSVVDYTNTFQTNKLTLSANGSEKIGGDANDTDLTTKGQSVTFVYVDAAEGWKNVQDSTSAVTGTSPYIIATGGTHAGGGGGGGGFRFASPVLAPATYPAKPLAGPAALPVTAQGYPIDVGAGGAGVDGPPAYSNNGANSVFSTITSTGGGGGGYGHGAPASGKDGGSGGGAGTCNPCGAGTGNTPPVSPAQGTNGGASVGAGYASGGGGGGALAAGSNGTTGPGSSRGGAGGGGAGFPNHFGTSGQSCGSFYYYSGGGGAGPRSCATTPTPAGGVGGGGPGVPPNGTAGTCNTGGGGGSASGDAAGANGGSGIVIIRYKFQ